MFNIVLHEPRIPGNVGTIGRLAFALNCKLHLIKPYGFGEITEKEVRRAGLDYWYDLEVIEYENNQEFKKDDYFYFGREDAGLPEFILNKSKETCITIPMTNSARSLNIANSVSIVCYEALRQNFASFKQFRKV